MARDSYWMFNHSELNSNNTSTTHSTDTAMSLFQPIEISHKDASSADIFHLGPHNCNVMFTSYEKGTVTGKLVNLTDAKNRLISGSIRLTINDKTQHIHAGEWFRIPSNTEHAVHYLSDCTVIEFWLDQAVPQEPKNCSAI
jgi:quercetin dioxygenase-like cupin family protein